MLTFGDRVRDVRKSLGLSQDRMSELLGVDRLSVLRWEKGQQFPRPPVLERLAEVAEKPVAWFFQDSANGSIRADDRPPAVLVGDLFTVLATQLREQLGDPTWSTEEEAAHVGDLLARARQRLGISREVMAEKILGWPQRTLLQLEKGTHPVAPTQLRDYLQRLGVSLQPLFWDAPAQLRGKATDMEGQPAEVYPTKRDGTWCRDCEVYRLLYPDFCCPVHRGSSWAREEAWRAVKRAERQLQRATRRYEKVMEEGKQP